MMGESLIQGGAPPTFMTDSMVEYILYGINGVKQIICDTYQMQMFENRF